jgi:hypothetical protein
MVMESIIGAMEVFIKEISSMGLDTDTELGKTNNSHIKVLIEWIKRKV